MKLAAQACDDRELVQMAVAGDAESFATLIGRHRDQLRRRIRSIVRNEFDADDVLQNTLLKVWRGLASFRFEADIRTWLVRIATNEALVLLRGESGQRLRRVEYDPTLYPTTEPCPDQRLVQKRCAAAVRLAAVSLPPKYRKVLVMRDLDELSERETALCLGDTIPAVKTRLFRARQMLKTKLRHSRAVEMPTAA